MVGAAPERGHGQRAAGAGGWKLSGAPPAAAPALDLEASPLAEPRWRRSAAERSDRHRAGAQRGMVTIAQLRC